MWQAAAILIAFLVDLFLFSLLVVALGSPLFFVAWRNELPETARRFVIGGGAVAFLAAVTSAGSRRLVRQCVEAGNTRCLDIGASGLLLTVFVGYALIAWIAAFMLARD